MVEGCPAGMLQFVDLGLARDGFEALCDTGQDPAAFLPMLRRFEASEAYRTRKHPPQLHDWLRKGMWRAWLRDAPEAPKPTPAVAAGAVPPNVVAALEQLGGKVGKWLAGAGWDEETRTVLTVSDLARRELVAMCGARSLAEMVIRVERAPAAAGQDGVSS